MNNRRPTLTVYIGNLPLGSEYPVRLQSMTNTDTLNTQTSVDQAMRIFDAGADYVRLTTQGIREAQNLANIKNELIKKGYSHPLIADVHFNPKVAELAATIVEKVRINPGNYTDKKKPGSFQLTEEQYRLEMERTKEKLLPLLEICKKHFTAIRIGVNHGSLSDRILNQYGNTPEGMAESAMEFLRICREADFHRVVLSMKASNPKIMVYSNRLLVEKMTAEGMFYPIHLGVTEAGEGEDGRIKSAVGIGTLLAEGIGDTVRVSLTEDPEAEIPIAKTLVESIYHDPNHENKTSYKNVNYQKRETRSVQNIGGDNVPVVVVNSGSAYNYSEQADYLFAATTEELKQISNSAKVIVPFTLWLQTYKKNESIFPFMTSDEYLNNTTISPALNFVQLGPIAITEALISKIINDHTVVLVLEGKGHEDFGASLSTLFEKKWLHPILLKENYAEDENEKAMIKSSTQLGSPFIDGIGDGIWLEAKSIDPLKTSFGILQACGARISKTEYISCPTCGRTSFNITKVLKEIKEKTSPLKGLKIAVMGCIVNGPGEMADADYGYVGAGKGKVTLYKGKTPIRKNIAEKDALKELLKIIDEK